MRRTAATAQTIPEPNRSQSPALRGSGTLAPRPKIVSMQTNAQTMTSMREGVITSPRTARARSVLPIGVRQMSSMALTTSKWTITIEQNVLAKADSAAVACRLEPPCRILRTRPSNTGKRQHRGTRKWATAIRSSCSPAASILSRVGSRRDLKSPPHRGRPFVRRGQSTNAAPWRLGIGISCN